MMTMHRALELFRQIRDVARNENGGDDYEDGSLDSGEQIDAIISICDCALIAAGEEE